MSAQSAVLGFVGLGVVALPPAGKRELADEPADEPEREQERQGQEDSRAFGSWGSLGHGSEAAPGAGSRGRAPASEARFTS